MSLAHMATRSMPMVSWRSMRMAILILVPTPSVAETNTGSRDLSTPRWNKPPNEPISPRTPVR